MQFTENKSPHAFSRRASAYNEMQNFEKAISDGTNAIKLDADCAEAYRARGRAYFCSDELELGACVCHCTRSSVVVGAVRCGVVCVFGWTSHYARVAAAAAAAAVVVVVVCGRDGGSRFVRCLDMSVMHEGGR